MYVCRNTLAILKNITPDYKKWLFLGKHTQEKNISELFVSWSDGEKPADIRCRMKKQPEYTSGSLKVVRQIWQNATRSGWSHTVNRPDANR